MFPPIKDPFNAGLFLPVRKQCSSGHWKYYPEEKWADGPDYCELGLDYGYLGDVGDGSNILPPGFYYVCVMEGPTFRFKP